MSLSERYHVPVKCTKCEKPHYVSIKDLVKGKKIHCDCGHVFEVIGDKEEKIKSTIEKLNHMERLGNELGIKFIVERKSDYNK